jgi:hypothetical protein
MSVLGYSIIKEDRVKNSITEKLLDLKERIQQAKQQKSRAEGKRDELLRRLKEDHGCKTVQEAEAKVRALEKQAAEAERTLEQGVDRIEKTLREKGVSA